jgi:hypothetical protein
MMCLQWLRYGTDLIEDLFNKLISGSIAGSNFKSSIRFKIVAVSITSIYSIQYVAYNTILWYFKWCCGVKK